MGVNVLLSLIFQPDMILEKRTIKLIFFEELNKSNSLIWGMVNRVSWKGKYWHYINYSA